jgi:hypothetical protein
MTRSIGRVTNALNEPVKNQFWREIKDGRWKKMRGNARENASSSEAESAHSAPQSGKAQTVMNRFGARERILKEKRMIS